MSTGKLVISLDFELLWGVRDVHTKDSYGANILGVWDSLPLTIDLFNKYDVKATFATVGFLFASSKEELTHFIPEKVPSYANSNFSPYTSHIDDLDDEGEKKYHFAPELIEEIKKHPQHEIGTHTFSHYYCLEEGQSIDEFRNDLEAAIEIARKEEIQLKSLVFPRNQFNQEYIEIDRHANKWGAAGEE